MVFYLNVHDDIYVNFLRRDLEDGLRELWKGIVATLLSSGRSCSTTLSTPKLLSFIDYYLLSVIRYCHTFYIIYILSYGRFLFHYLVHATTLLSFIYKPEVDPFPFPP